MNPRIYLSEHGWVIDTPFGLSKRQLQAAIDWHKKIQVDRIKTMHGEKRERCTAALYALTVDTLRQNILPNQHKEHMLIGR